MSTERTVKLTAFDCKDYLIAWHWSILRHGVYETSSGTEILPMAERLTRFGIEKFGITVEKYTIIRWE